MKRVMDVAVAGILFLLLLPVMLVVAAIIFARMGPPVLIRQRRPGLNAKLFSFYKFRTMTDAAGANGKLLPDELRITFVGRWLRAFSLDELPQLLNVLKGDMSLVGPRPLLAEYLPLYSARQARRHEVRPGITGWAQVNGRNAISWVERFELDVWYVDNASLWLDIKILVQTARNVLRRRGINHRGDETMPRFTGIDKTKQAQEAGGRRRR